MRTHIFAITTLLSSSTFAFTTGFYTGKTCTGAAMTLEPKVSDGCHTEGAGSFQGIINKWKDESDNKLILATYSDGVCCHSNLIEMIDWQDGCFQAMSGAQSWRVIDPNEPEKGKEGETYAC